MIKTVPFLAFLLLVNLSNTFGQWMHENFTKRNLKIHTDTSVLVFEIIEETLEIKPSVDLTYFWYLNRKILSNKGGIGGQLLDGSFTRYNRQDYLMEQGSFKKGLKWGEWKYWDEMGNLIRIEPYKNGLLDGKVTIYEKEGEIKTLTYRKGKLTRNTKDAENKSSDSTIRKEPKSTVNVSATESPVQTDSVPTITPVSKRRGRTHKTSEATNQNLPPNENQ
ncbi:MAG TPA: hypothetical protein DCQ26_01130 [Marinilabiliales bacterium]|nr:MAG: hypothetical protein A2W95_11085 [Bacteroidetes bacterium GWA2_40_14]OFX59725.1 MAG: hypothetical protein A2W84_01760 [Bacteroidetes bacterium GWC2_40_13]OFX70894.1 MAG: hypothetical protein A2W96_14070 [Bacteroidetes bacterium GWD2_40_43]OFX95694.1 MAG: hypothetical protein A2W97_06810 [Bacteroidetes bacterium GWE2_40_63]OFY21231.1 MAG: hypothetical protein A2W88_19380 [Bacteroidetes bacterium GWF2_40_13]OFZ23506.1 MAG: hypothetical protein A2437_05625 [Bacteroidetes bacterium RIFOXYC